MLNIDGVEIVSNVVYVQARFLMAAWKACDACAIHPMVLVLYVRNLRIHLLGEGVPGMEDAN